MASAETVEPTRRDFLFLATGAAAVVGAAAVTWPFVNQMNPDAATIAAGEPVELDLSGVAAGQTVKLFWRGKTIFVMHRTQAQIAEAREVPMSALPDPASDESRAQRPDWLVVIGICTHLGCIPLRDEGDYHGWVCPCHGSYYDTAGRIRKGPAPRNLDLPPYKFVGDAKLVVG